MRHVRGLLAALLVVGGCSSSQAPSGDSAGTATAPHVRSTGPEGTTRASTQRTGRVLDSDGIVVARFEFESGWVVPDRWTGDDTTPTRTGAATRLAVELAAPGTYVFVLGEYAVSQRHLRPLRSRVLRWRHIRRRRGRK